ncbi:MAG: ATP-binding protein [Alphaproteobacteria bacterium]|nr:ATP-binding protein [Alphaproteobacteria bacterium]
MPIVLIQIISTYVFFDRHWERMAGRLALAVAGEVAFLVERVEQDQSEAYLSELTQDTLKHMQLSIKYVEGGKIPPDPVRYYGRGDVIKRILSGELRYKLSRPYRILVDVEEKWIQVQVQLEDGALVVTSPERRLFSSSGYVFLLWMIGVSAVLLIVAVLFMRNQIRPIKRLAIAAERFGMGRDVPFFKIEGAREVRQAAKSFIEMRDRINKQIQQRTAMLAGVSHDLRTPLTRLKLQLEMMKPDKGNAQDIQEMKADIGDMERMINAYLQFAKGEGNEEMERVNLIDILNRLKQRFGRGEMTVHTGYDEDEIYLHLRPVAMERCLANILSNAGEYARNVWIDLAVDDEFIRVFIDDDGPGIAPESYEDVFKPFFREDKSRNTKTGGVGLGLPIAQDIILAHGGTIHLSKSPKSGLRVEILLPI